MALPLYETLISWSLSKMPADLKHLQMVLSFTLLHASATHRIATGMFIDCAASEAVLQLSILEIT